MRKGNKILSTETILGKILKTTGPLYIVSSRKFPKTIKLLVTPSKCI